MKKKLIALLVMCLLLLSLVGCSVTYQEAASENNDEDFCAGYFTTIIEWRDDMGIYRIVYANDTNVKYMVVTSGYKFGITPLYNTDGTLQIYDSE